VSSYFRIRNETIRKEIEQDEFENLDVVDPSTKMEYLMALPSYPPSGDSFTTNMISFIFAQLC